MRGDGQPPSETTDAAGPDGPAGGDGAWLDAPDIALPPANPRSAREEALSFAAAVAMHGLAFAVFLVPVSGIGAGGSDFEAIGIEIVTAAPALQSRSTERGRGVAAADADVREREGVSIPVPQETASLDSRAVEQPKPDEVAAPPADLVVKDWVEPPRPPDPTAQAPLIAPNAAEGRAVDAPSPQRPTPSDQVMSVTNSIPATDLIAQIEGGAAARGREQIAVAADAMAGARAGRRDEFRLSIRRALAENPPRPIEGVGGVVEVKFQIDRNGRVGAVQILRSSGNSALDERVLSSLRTARMPIPHPAVPDDALWFDIPFTFAVGSGR